MGKGLKYKLKGKLLKEIPDKLTAKEFIELQKNGSLIPSNGKSKRSSSIKKDKKYKKVLTYNDDPNRSREYEVTFTGQFYSVNQSLSNHWSKTQKEKKRLKEIFALLILEANIPTFRKVEISCRFWSRHDVNGLGTMMKWFEDTLVDIYRISNDTKKQSGEQIITPDESLKNNTIIFKIIDTAL